MNYDESLLSAAVSAGTCSEYYGLCSEYPLVPGQYSKKAPFKEILAAAEGNMPLTKQRGPGIVFEVGGLPEGVSLNIIVQSGGTIETDFVVEHADQAHRGTFAILCNEAMMHAGHSAPNPPYPRPVCASADAVVAVVRRLQGMVIALEKALKCAE